ncbi:hypothetical protein COW98_01335 [Candidatus Roizmanbacteria bacterium CG22_combo_CG10-13_8_21_14_all_35_9]|uniref:Uncharacterized protein n=4 Tax=Candidatus Roizmaniibacteriota TaxID=1752723 RepID=A0A2M8F3T0_9BACT|nr:MAG: hypothetical protein COX47_02380 [Candidatus Roizmanbacteria bacterium CG23_combo_of_CG06-09_8_20_14_all_35_49]PIP62897.1 MAG: hypothetical protein COW98_01335 [Candidatus Roizmanbacteria bacterium CG22_combo_CG10-13_8_21_14_all_35_9]PIY71449.1 MAG: hypothetical protein COY88_00425 [Candidatus Roizmanbacteria bacterium CG_4_10_14_0_8_um_filter_35_28]PJC33963.1 MAG: hypothetical protein CO048_01810 [Candidatus Roizmanbacteria bacterium CG_4_9_14_0_2_um_filter_35_15]PJC82893.1 MAG: hypoth
MKILIIGGHLAPALAIIEELKKTKKNIDIIFVGRKYSLDSEKTISLEYKEIISRKIPFIPLTAGRLTRILSTRSLRNILRVPLGFYNAFFIINQEKPDIILSFGSYLAVPLVFWGYLYRIPVFTHEQTIRPGLANKIIALMAKKIFLSFSESRSYFPLKKTVVVGNPVRESVLKIKERPFMIQKDRPVLYITGGSLGSHSINEHIKRIIVQLLNCYIVIHQTGDVKEYRDYEDLQTIRNKLPEELASRYFLKKHFFEKEIGYIYFLADLVIGRAGANTFFELLTLEKPALFIPLPWASGREQQHHAEIFARSGVGEIFHQIESSEKLYRLIVKMIDNLISYKGNFAALHHLYKKNASQFMVKEILK